MQQPKKEIAAPPAHNPGKVPRGVGPGEVWIDFEADAAGMVTIGDYQVATIDEVHAAYTANFPGKVTPIVGGKFKVAIPVSVLKQATPIIRAENREHAAAQRRAAAMIVRDEELLSGRSENKIFPGKRIGLSIKVKIDE